MAAAVTAAAERVAVASAAAVTVAAAMVAAVTVAAAEVVAATAAQRCTTWALMPMVPLPCCTRRPSCSRGTGIDWNPAPSTRRNGPAWWQRL